MRGYQGRVLSVWVVILVVMFSLVLSLPLIPQQRVNGATDRGIWTQLALYGGEARNLAIDPTTPARLYVTADAGLFRSKDGGDHWEQLLVGDNTYSVAIDGISGNAIYVGTTNNGVFRSTDAGDHWQQVTTGLTNLKV